jgi:Holliday junction resolvase|tara:strand:+ start:4436 stop:4732 length:297 start_codon:yes stop_codon:yes gene_type:complete
VSTILSSNNAFNYSVNLYMTEQQIQYKKIKELESEGYYVLKLTKTNKNGIPDLLALHPDKEILFVEVKTKKGKVSKLQQYRIKELIEHGFRAEVYKGT